VRGDITVEEFESQVADLLAHERADRPVDMLFASRRRLTQHARSGHIICGGRTHPIA
jgi:hypothetical protein